MHEISGAERAIAGGGRYDQLIELFDGPPTPAVGFGMGDVVLTNVLIDKGLLDGDVAPVPDVFVVALTDSASRRLAGIVSSLRFAGLHTRFSYKATRSLSKLLKEASNFKARLVVILDDDTPPGQVIVKDLAGGAQTAIVMSELAAHCAAGKGVPGQG
jgi:histidyl-tRNA synthetase